MARANRADIAIETLANLGELLLEEHGKANEEMSVGLARAHAILTTFSKAILLSRPAPAPKPGRPRNQPKGE